jgi:hypothetical protein
MCRLPERAVLLMLALLALAGCASPIKRGKSLLTPVWMSPDAVVIELFFVRFPLGDTEANDHLWQEVDEQHFPAELRKKLAQNGFRVGLVGGQIPAALFRLLELDDKPAPTGGPSAIEVSRLASEPRVIRRRMSLRSGVGGQIIASEVYSQLPVLIGQSGEVCGQTYCQAQGLLAVKAFPEGDGRIRLEVVPEVHHDQPRQRWVGDQGVLRLEAQRPKRAFDDLGIPATLAPGDMLLLSSLPSRPGSLGHHFFTDNKGQLEQKLLVIRLAETQHNGLFSPPEVLPVAEQ